MTTSSIVTVIGTVLVGSWVICGSPSGKISTVTVVEAGAVIT
jgi:hypothetical protein